MTKHHLHFYIFIFYLFDLIFQIINFKTRMFDNLFKFLFTDNSFNRLLKTFTINDQVYKYYDLTELKDDRLGNLPFL